MTSYLENYDIIEHIFLFYNYEILDDKECEYIEQTVDFCDEES
jgi:hypothetical protein